MPIEPQQLPNGIESIALSFSGGGFRAASFTLGCSSYLNYVPYGDAPLLQKVKFISSASGGSITNLCLSSMLREGLSFDAIYKFLIEKMKGTEMLDKAFEILNNDDQWAAAPDKSRNFINAFSKAYDQQLFNGRTFASLSSPAKSTFYIEEISLNTTEFYNGLNFRFGTSGVLGNKYLPLKRDNESVQKIKLGDIMACSSCFPAGFEPFMFPHDFSWKNGGEELDKKDLWPALNNNSAYDDATNGPDNEKLTFGFMDGGIDDNQGIYSFMLADERASNSEEKKGFDIYMPCDVSSNFLDDPFKYPIISQDPSLSLHLKDLKRKVVSGIAAYAIIDVLLIAASVIFIIMDLVTPGYILLGVSITALVLPIVAGLVIVSKVKSIVKKVTPVFGNTAIGNSTSVLIKKYIGLLLQRPINELLSMIMARVESVLLLVMTVFMKRIRQQSYSNLYAAKSLDVYEQLVSKNNAATPPQQIDGGRLWKDHAGMTSLYLLCTKNNSMLVSEIKAEVWDYDTDTVSPTDKRLLKDVMNPQPILRNIIDDAVAMGTTLWFDDTDTKNKSLQKLLIAGQATMCFNLLRIAYRFNPAKPEWQIFKDQLVKDWGKFQTNPQWLYNEQVAKLSLPAY